MGEGGSHADVRIRRKEKVERVRSEGEKRRANLWELDQKIWQEF